VIGAAAGASSDFGHAACDSAISAELRAASVTLRPISAVVALCSLMAAAID